MDVRSDGRRGSTTFVGSSKAKDTAARHLGTWRMASGSASGYLSRKRTYRTGKLAADRVSRLEALPGWSWNWRKER